MKLNISPSTTISPAIEVWKKIPQNCKDGRSKMVNLFEQLVAKIKTATDPSDRVSRYLRCMTTDLDDLSVTFGSHDDQDA